MKLISCENLVIGSGIAGLSLALKLARHGQVHLIAKNRLTETNTIYAQGGIASVLAADDSFDKHVADTLTAGAGLCHGDIVRMVVENGPPAIRELIELGVRFTPDPTSSDFPFHLSREGGHSERRVIHAHDLTGREVVETLAARVRAHPQITVTEHHFAVDLITTDKYAPDFARNRCLGAYVLNHDTKQVYQLRSQRTFLCTGGHGKVYLYTSNPDNATGDGLAMGWRAGCKVANLEFMQFHPTCLYHPQAKTFLISEAVRGEGGILKTQNGEAFMQRYHPLADLAPRDIVARAIDMELKKSGLEHVYLDVRQLGRERLLQLFPNIFQTCLNHGIDIATAMIPVVPAAHYSCGGLVTDDWGRTGVHDLFAVGEVACTGLHGANRLASNSLLEAVVFADRVADYCRQHPLSDPTTAEVPDWNPGRAAPADERVLLTHAWDEIRRLMWHYVGIVRSDMRLRKAYDRLTVLRQELDKFYWDYEIDEHILEVRNLAQVAWLTVRCAMARKESRGIHYNIDYIADANQQSGHDTIIY